MNCDPLICRCMKVSKATVQHAISHKALRTVDEITDATDAGGACMCCHRRLEQMLDEHWSLMAEAQGDGRVPALLCAAPVDIK
jgi:NAD(P)H-nitrite reductase large subunit